MVVLSRQLRKHKLSNMVFSRRQRVQLCMADTCIETVKQFPLLILLILFGVFLFTLDPVVVALAAGLLLLLSVFLLIVCGGRIRRAQDIRERYRGHTRTPYERAPSYRF